MAVTAKKTETWAAGLVLTSAVSDDVVAQKVQDSQIPKEERMTFDLERIRVWVNAHRPDRVTKKDAMQCVEPPVLKLVCCTSLERIKTAVRGVECDHLTCFDLSSYIHTMRNIPPKHAWCCPVCDKPAPMHQLKMDAFAQSVVDSTAENVTEVLVADNGKFEVSATEEPMEDSSEDEAMNTPAPAPAPTAADLQQFAMNLGRAFSAPAPKPKPKPAPVPPKPPPRERSRSPKRNQASPPHEEPVDKMLAWKKLQGIAPPEAPKPVEQEKRIGWLPDGATCSYCSKTVVAEGGVYCGRRKGNGSTEACGGCFDSICWKCMNKNKEKVGKIKTTKNEFSELGPDAWWMHEKCMTAKDKKAYFGEEEDDDDDDDDKPKKKSKDSDDEGDGKFAWE
eukprot:TRINITY_DN9379_c0_g1_i1.p1 TRINITY_DN9379_c0_g1~~TRINITY_DN9379_c0_g1_i1.p1  ORF type:complete len:399 (-),score=111.38 TRINITY_DN9379_c0_g1_i1:107-1282(-)